jgi:sec-independent protein translocase protein TatC
MSPSPDPTLEPAPSVPVASGQAATPAKAEPEDDVQLSLRGHLFELRLRVKWAVVWLSLGFLVCGNWASQIFHWLMVPVLQALPEGERALHYSSSTEPFFIYLKVALYGSIFVSSPAVLWQMWAFVAPGLYRREKRAVAPFAFVASLFFVAGATFCYFVILPPAFEFLLTTAGEDMKPVLMMDEQLGLVMTLMLAFAIIFELPMVLTVLAMIGLIDWRFLSKYRRHAIVLNTLIAAVITPTGDPFNLALMALPMMLCYELGVLGAWIFGKKDAVARFSGKPAP